MSAEDAQRPTRAFLEALCPDGVLVTHASRIHLGPDRVLKLKRAITLPYLDFGTVAARERFCRREVELNRRAAPGLYRGVRPVLPGPSLGSLDAASTPDALDWVVEMARVPDTEFLPSIAAAGRLDEAMQDALGDAVAAFHASLPPLRDADQVRLVRAIVESDQRAFDAAGWGTRPEVLALTETTRRCLDEASPFLRHREAEGFVRRLHGDLHLGNLCLWQGRPTLFDALEFDEAFATADTWYDLAFLLMDLDRRVSRSAANRVMARYVARNGDAAGTGGLPLWLGIRAAVRALVAAARASEGDADAARSASEGIERARGYLAPVRPMLVAIGGLPGTGKTTQARLLAPRLARAPGALHLRSDTIRKRLEGVAPETRLPDQAYAPERSGPVFDRLCNEAAAALAHGHGVVADAVWGRPEERAAIEAVGKRAGVPFLGIWLEAGTPSLEARLAARTGDASDADARVLHRLAALDPGAIRWMRIDGNDRAACARAIARSVDALAPGVLQGPLPES